MATVPLGIEQVVLRALAKEPKERFASVAAFADALGEASQSADLPMAFIPGEQPAPGSPAVAAFATVAVPNEAPPALVALSASPETPPHPDTPACKIGNAALTATTPAAPFAATMPAPTGVLSLPVPAHPQRRRTIVSLPAALLIGLVVLVVAGALLGSLSLLAHFGILDTHTGPTMPMVARGGTWTIDSFYPPDSLIPNGGSSFLDTEIDQGLYLPLFYGDAQGVIHPGMESTLTSIATMRWMPSTTRS